MPASYSDPPRDANQRVVPHDDAAIPGTEYVLRYVHSAQLMPAENGGRRLSSGVFSPSSPERDPYKGMSINFLNLMERDRIAPEGYKGPEFEGVIKVRVADIRRITLRVGTDPLPEDAYHGNVWDLRTRSHKRDLMACFEWVQRPPDVAE